MCALAHKRAPSCAYFHRGGSAVCVRAHVCVGVRNAGEGHHAMTITIVPASGWVRCTSLTSANHLASRVRYTVAKGRKCRDEAYLSQAGAGADSAKLGGRERQGRARVNLVVAHHAAVHNLDAA